MPATATSTAMATRCWGGEPATTRMLEQRRLRNWATPRVATSRVSCASRGKPSRPHESWIRSAWKRKGSGLRSSVEWAAKERKNLARGRLARGKSAQGKRWDPSEKMGCQSRPQLGIITVRWDDAPPGRQCTCLAAGATATVVPC